MWRYWGSYFAFAIGGLGGLFADACFVDETVEGVEEGDYVAVFEYGGEL